MTPRGWNIPGLAPGVPPQGGRRAIGKKYQLRLAADLAAEIEARAAATKRPVSEVLAGLVRQALGR